uniref:Uncharacterized protein n=1 Tax=Arundo donax TaxID=35708 RepID=A0A0A8ZEP7_ARUDO
MASESYENHQPVPSLIQIVPVLSKFVWLGPGLGSALGK